MEEAQGRPPALFEQETRLLNDLSEGSSFSFKPGNQWAINAETGEATFDTKFFEEKGYSPTQALFASLHVLRCHLVEVKKLIDEPGGSEQWEDLKGRVKEKKRLQVWENCRTDIKGNLEIMRAAPSLSNDVRRLYREKLWPETDFSNSPKHLQFAYAVLRQAMIPDEDITIDQDVRDAINRLRNVEGRDVIALATDSNQDPLLGLMLSRKYIEPVVDALFEEDLKDKKRDGQSQDENDQSNGGTSGNSQNENSQSSQNGSEEEAFKEDYADYDRRHPEPMDEGEKEEKIKAAKDKQSISARYAAGYQEENAVGTEDVAAYKEEYGKIEKYIEPLREIFRRIVEQRTIDIRRLVALKEEGVLIDPGLVAQTYMDINSGKSDPKTMRDFEGLMIEESVPRSFTVRMVADQSSSMEGDKAVFQRRSAILVMEALSEFSELIDKERKRLTVGLDVKTELRSFGVPEGTRLYKPITEELSEKQRIGYFKGLLWTGGGTNDFDALYDIEKEIKATSVNDPLYLHELQIGKKKDIVIVLSDGESANVRKVQDRTKTLRDMGIIVIGLGMSKDSQDVATTYMPDGHICYNIADLPIALQKLLTEHLASLEINK